MKYQRECAFITEKIKYIYKKYISGGINNVVQKSSFDLVTNIDCEIEAELTKSIKQQFPSDNIHGEETVHDDVILGRTWTIDPIDGTCNLVAGIPLYGIQCSLIDDNKIVFAAIYLPHFNEMYVAESGGGCYLNGIKVFVKKSNGLNNAIISLGDYPHKYLELAKLQHRAVEDIYSKIAKIRMFGAACIDFAMVASGRTDATIVITKNLWDLAPGILICEEAGATVSGLTGQPYRFGDNGVIACATEEIKKLILKNFSCSR